MKSSQISIYLLLFGSLLIQHSNFLYAWGDVDNYNDEYYESAYNCGDPLNCGSVNFLFHVGVAPTLWRNRGAFSAVSCNALAIPGVGQSIVNLFPLPSFKKLFHVPWVVGGQIGYALNNNVEFYVELNYRQARARGSVTATPAVPSFTLLNVTIPNDVIDVSFNVGKYRAYDAYIGARYYWGRCFCDQLALFLGAQFGFVHHKEIDFNFAITSVSCSTSSPLTSPVCVPFARANTVPASGLNLGADWCLGCGWSLDVMLEVIATCAPRSNSNIPIVANCSQLPSLLPSNIIVGSLGTEIFFPVTVGLKYSF